LCILRKSVKGTNAMASLTADLGRFVAELSLEAIPE